MNKYVICYASLETGDVTFLETYSSLTEAQQRLKPTIKNYMADEQPDVEYKIVDKKDFDESQMCTDDKDIVYRLKSQSAKVYKKFVKYEQTSVAGYVRPVNFVQLIAKVSIKELYVEGVQSGIGHVAPAPRMKPPRQTVSFMAELGNALQSGVTLRSTKRKSIDKEALDDDIDRLLKEMCK